MTLQFQNADRTAFMAFRRVMRGARRAAWPALLLVATATVGGCVNRESASFAFGAEPPPVLESFYVNRFSPDQRGINILIMEDLIRRGFRAQTGPAGAHPQDVDAVVTYRDKWMWDITMYMLELDITVRNPRTKYPIAVGNSFHTSLTRRSSKEMVEEVLTNIFNELPVDPNRIARKRSPPPAPATGSSEVNPATADAPGDVEKKYERLIAMQRKEQERLNCTGGSQAATSQSCQDLAFQINLLEAARDRELAKPGGTGGGARAAAPASGPTSIPPWQRPDTDCGAGDIIELKRDRSAIEQAIQDYAYLTGIGSPFPAHRVESFRKLTQTKTYCGYMALRADILLPVSAKRGTQTREPEQTHEFIIEKKDGKLRVTGCPTC